VDDDTAPLDQELPRRRWARRAFLVLLAVLLPACDACERPKPFNPYGKVQGEADAGSDAGTSAGPGTDAGEAPPTADTAFVPHSATRLAGDEKTWTHEDRTLRAPDGQVFELVLPGPLALDRQQGVAAWTVPASPAARDSGGELWWYPKGAEPRLLAETPGFVPSGAGCTRTATLDQTGRYTVTLEVSAECTTRLLPRAPVRAVLVVTPVQKKPIVAGLRVARAGPHETLTFEVDTSDRDQDNLDDLLVTVRLDRLGEVVKAQLAWYERAAGPARDGTLPALDFATMVNDGYKEAIKRNAPDLAARAVAIQRLWTLLCAESGTATILDLDGSPYRCNAGKSLQALQKLQVTGLISEGLPVQALSVHERDGWVGPGLSHEESHLSGGPVEDAMVRRRISGVLVTASRPVAAGSMIRWSPLRYETPLSLLVRGRHSVTRISLPSGMEEDASAAVDPWPLAIRDATGALVRNLIFPCDTPILAMLTSKPDGTLVQLPLKSDPVLLSPRPGRCVGLATPATPVVSVLGWAASPPGLRIGLVGTEALIALPPAGAPIARTTPTAIPTTLGILVTTEGKSELWQGPQLKGQLTDCVVAPDASSAACLRDGRGVVFMRGDVI
jgi:hypothetical protein